MTECFLSDEDIRKLDRDLRILIATNGTLTRILNVVADDEIVVQIVKQKIHRMAPHISDFGQTTIGRVLQRRILLKGRSSGIPFVAAESFIAIDLLPAEMTTRLTETDCPIGEVMAAGCLETFKEAAKVWLGSSPGWVASAGLENSRRRIVGRRYRIITRGQPIMVISEYFLRNVFERRAGEGHDHHKYSKGNGTRS